MVVLFQVMKHITEGLLVAAEIGENRVSNLTGYLSASLGQSRAIMLFSFVST